MELTRRSGTASILHLKNAQSLKIIEPANTMTESRPGFRKGTDKWRSNEAAYSERNIDLAGFSLTRQRTKVFVFTCDA
jgi:hypothetical protein